jgi:predicted AAA+ superfamily ATPase
MIPRPRYLDQLGIAAGRSPVTALMGPRQCGKTTLAHIFGRHIAAPKSICFFFTGVNGTGLK